MKRVLLWGGSLAAALSVGFAVGAGAQKGPGDAVVLPAKISAADMSGAIFDRPDTLRTERGDNVVLDVTTLKSSDGRFASGMYRSGPSHFEIDEPYGVDEFMYFIEGGVTLTSADGTVHEIAAGEAVTLPKEWTGTWQTDGYTKIWVIYSPDGSGL